MSVIGNHTVINEYTPLLCNGYDSHIAMFQAIQPIGEFYEQEFIEIGVGFFGITQIKDDFNFLYGARVGYVKADFEFKSSFQDEKTELDGYSLSPTIGFEYYITENISLGGDISFHYEDLDGNEIDREDDEKIDASQKTTDTDTSVNIRFYF